MHAHGTFLAKEIASVSTRGVTMWVIALTVALGGGAIAAVNGSIGWTIACAIAALAFVWALILDVRTLRQPQRHRAVARLLRLYGCTLEQLSVQVEHELQGSGPTAGTVRATPSWLFGYSGTRDVVLVRLDQVAWVYKHTLTKTRNGIKQGDEHSVIVHTLYAPKVELNLRTKSIEADQLVQYVAQRAPWAWVGYDAQRKAMWATPAGRHQLVGTAATRREHMQGQA
jgi:hypothetical protein